MKKDLKNFQANFTNKTVLQLTEPSPLINLGPAMPLHAKFEGLSNMAICITLITEEEGSTLKNIW